MKLAENLKTLRTLYKLTQKDLAEKLKIYPSNISDWENCVSRPEYEHLVALADIFNVTVGQLLGVED